MSEELRTEQENINEEFVVLKPIQRVWKIFVSPGEVFRSIDIKPNFLLPIIIASVFSLGFYLIFFSEYKALILQAIEQQMVNSPNPLPEEMIQKTANFTAIATVISAPIMTVIGMLINALYYWLFGLILKAKGSYKKYFSLMANVSLVTMLSIILSGIMVLITGEFNIEKPVTSLASLLPDSMMMTPLYGMALQIEVFNIWRLVLIYMGLKEIGELSHKKALIMVLLALFIMMLYLGGTMWISGLANQTI